MTSLIIDATGIDPTLGNYSIVDARDRTNEYDLWTEYLCLSPTVMPCLSTCVFGAIAEPPEEWYDEDGKVRPERAVDGKLFPPAFFEGQPVAAVESFVCGPLVTSSGGAEASFGLPQEDWITRALDEIGWPVTKDLLRRIQSAVHAEKQSSLSAELVKAYLGTTYSAEDGDQTIHLRIGTKCEELAAYLTAVPGLGAAFLTAWNPKGGVLSADDNRHRNRLLETDVRALAKEAFPGLGIGSDPKWAPEESLLAIGLTFDQAVHLGRHYGQNAIIWVEDDSVPKLVLLC